MALDLSAYRLSQAPYYCPSGPEVSLYKQAYAHRLPVLLKGPTGSGKTRFVEYMAHTLGLPLVTLACTEDMTASDLVGRFLLDETGTVWHDGPLTQAVRGGAICYLDEVVEARQDTTVVIHPLIDSRRTLPLEKRGELVHAHPDFQLVVSYNPGYQSQAKDLKTSTRQRFVAIDFDYPSPDIEVDIVVHETRASTTLARQLVDIANRTRQLKSQGLAEGASTRLLIYAGKLIVGGLSPKDACELALVQPLTDDADMTRALLALVAAHF